MSYSFSALGQQTGGENEVPPVGYYVFPPDWDDKYSISFLDSLRAEALENGKDYGIDSKRLGKHLWTGRPHISWAPNTPNKFKGISFTCF
jgi:hypothetical protein